MRALPKWMDVPGLGEERRYWESLARAQGGPFLSAATVAYGAVFWEREDCPLWFRRVAAECLWRTGKRAEAETILHQIQSEPDLPDDVAAWVQLNLSELRKESGTPEEAKAARTRARHFAARTDRADIRAVVDMLEGIEAYGEGRYGEALALYRRALLCFEALDMENEAGGLLGNLALCEQAMGHFTEAIGHFGRAEAIAERNGDRLGVGRTRYNLSVIYREMGDYDGAAVALESALAILQELEHLHGMALVSNALGVLYFRMERHDEALAAYTTALKWKEEAGAYGDLATTHINRGECLLKSGRTEAAREAFAAGLACVERHGPERMRWACQFGFAQIAWTKRDFRETRRRFLEAFEYVVEAREEGNRDNLLLELVQWLEAEESAPFADKSTRLGDSAFFQRLADLLSLPATEDTAGAILDFAIAAARSRETKPPLAALLRLRADACERAGDLSTALELYREVRLLERSVLNEKGERLRAALAIRHRLEETRQLTLSERRENEVLRSALERVVESHTEKQEVLEVIAHDLRNGLGGIRAMCELLNADFTSTIDPADRALSLQTMRDTAGDLLSALEDLLADTGRREAAGEAGVTEGVDFRRIIESVADLNRVAAAARNIRLIAELPPDPVILKVRAAWLREIVDNYISNALKYAPSDSTVTATLETSLRACLLRVDDEGAGVAAAAVPGLFKRFGLGPTGDRSGTGLGLAIVKRLADKMGGSCSYETSLKGGASFRVSLPLEALNRDSRPRA